MKIVIIFFKIVFFYLIYKVILSNFKCLLFNCNYLLYWIFIYLFINIYKSSRVDMMLFLGICCRILL